MPSTVGIVASGEDVLNDAVFWVDASRSSVVSGALSNLGTGGSTLNAVFGNSTGVDSFDPALLTHTGTNYLYLPGVNGNYASTPASGAFNPTSDVEVVVRVSLAAFNVQQEFFGNSAGLATGGYEFFIRSTGLLTFRWSNGITELNSTAAQSVTAAGLVTGATYWFKVTFDVDNGASGSQGRFYWAADQPTEPVSWNQFTAPAAGVGTTVIAASANQAGIGAYYNGGANPVTGAMYRCIVRNGIGGTTVFDADFTAGITSGAQTTFTESSANAATVTINRSTSGRKAVAVTRPILLFGTDDYLEVADNDLLDFGASDSFTVVAVVRQWATPTSFGRLIDKKNGGGAALGWQLANNGTAIQPGLYIGDTTNQTAQAASTSTAGQLRVFGGQVDRSAQRIYGINNTLSAGVSTTSVGALTNTLPMRIGVNATTATNNQDFELVAAAVWRRALNANEIATIVARYT